MNTLTLILAQIFDKFKAANPKLAAGLILLFGLIIFAAENGLGELIGYDLAVIVKWTALVLGLLQGSRTQSFVVNK
jgi:hypothetical protein